MKSTRILIALIAAAALTLSACGSSSDGTPTVGESPSVSADAGDETADDSTDTSDDTSDDAAASETDPADTGSDVVVAGDLDAQSAAWFTEFCGISAPFDDFFGALMGAAMAGAGGDASDTVQLTELRTALVDGFTNLGDAMTKVGQGLDGMAPPTISGGAEAADLTVAGLAQGGPMLKDIGQQVAGLDVSSSEAFNAELEKIMDSVDDLDESFGIDSIDLDDATRAAIEKLPACEGSMLFSSF